MEKQDLMKLVITEPSHFSKQAYERLSNNFDVKTLKTTQDLKDHIEEIEILFIRLGIVFNEELLKKAKSLKIICTPTTGLDHIDIGYCKKNNIKIISLKGEVDFLGTIPSTAEHTFTLLTAVNRYLSLATQHTQHQLWNREEFKSFNLFGKTMGILGLGRVGKQVAEYGKSFGMHIIAYDKNPTQQMPEVKKASNPEEVFKTSDFVSIHLPLDDFNIKFVNKTRIELMKPTACLINTSRGQIWDEQAVAEALLSQKIRGVATDVVFDEVSKNRLKSPIFKVDATKYNCIITPHIAGATFDSMTMTEVFIANRLIEHV